MGDSTRDDRQIGATRSLWRSCFTVHNILLCGAMLFFWKSLRLYSFPIMLVETITFAEDFDGSGILKIIFMLAQLATLAVILMITWKYKHDHTDKRVLMITTLIGLAAVFALYFHIQNTSNIDALFIVGVVCVGIMTSVLAIAVVQRVLRLRISNSLFILIASFIIYYLLDLLTPRTLTVGGLIVYVIFIVLCSAVTFAFSSDSSASLRPYKLAAVRDLPWAVILIEWFFACFGSVIVSAFIGMRIGHSGDRAESYITFGIMLILAAILGLVAYIAVHTRRTQHVPLLILLVGIICWCVMSIAVFFNNSLRPISLSFDHIFILAVWAILAYTIARRKLPVLPCTVIIYALFIAAQYFVASDIVFNVGPIAALVSSTSSAFVVVVLIMAIAVVAAVTLLWRILHTSIATDSQENNQPQNLCERAFYHTELTERERIVAEAFYRGHSVARIADDNGLSEATIKTHANHIYRKLGIHSRQELIRYVDSFNDFHPIDQNF